MKIPGPPDRNMFLVRDPIQALTNSVTAYFSPHSIRVKGPFFRLFISPPKTGKWGPVFVGGWIPLSPVLTPAAAGPLRIASRAVCNLSKAGCFFASGLSARKSISKCNLAQRSQNHVLIFAHFYTYFCLIVPVLGLYFQKKHCPRV
jgi:hypothetical protein